MDNVCYVYILRCCDGSYYTGCTSDLEIRLGQHQAGSFHGGYTHSPLPVELVWSEAFPTHDAAFRAEHQIKGWTRAKKEALILGDWEAIHDTVARERRRRERKRG